MQLVKPINDFDPIHGLMMSSLTGKAVLAAVRLKVFDELERGPATAGELSGRLGTVEARTEALLDLLAALRLVERVGPAYGNAPCASEFLVSSSLLYQGLAMELTMAFTREVEDDIAGLLAGGAIDEGSAAGDWSGEEIMEGTAQDARGSGLYRVVEVVAGLDGFDRFTSMCDIGGNHGLFTMGVLDRNPAMTGVILDLPPVAERAGERCRDAGYEGRIEARGFNFRTEPLPEAAFDLALTSHFLYMVKAELGPALARIAAGLKPGGWFVSHHYAGRRDAERGATACALDLLTRLAGYPSHFIERDELAEALSSAGFSQVSFQPVEAGRMGLITTARKDA